MLALTRLLKRSEESNSGRYGAHGTIHVAVRTSVLIQLAEARHGCIAEYCELVAVRVERLELC